MATVSLRCGAGDHGNETEIFAFKETIYGGVEGPPHIFFRHHAISYG